MSLTRKHIFIFGKEVRPNEWADEIDQLCNYLSGNLAGRLILNLDHTVDPCLFIRNINTDLTKLMLDLKKSDVSKFQINNKLQMISLVTDIAPINVDSTTKVVNLNAQYLDNLPLASFLLNGKSVEWYIPFYFDGIPTVGQKIFSWIVPAGTNMELSEVRASSERQLGNYPSDDASINLSLKKNGGNIALLFLDSGSSLWTSTVGFGPTAIFENEIITLNVDAIVGTEKTRNIDGRVKFKQALVS